MAFSSNSAALAGTNRTLRRWIGVCAAISLAFFASQLAEIPARSALRGYDNTFNYLWLRSAMVDGDWDFRNDLPACDTLAPDHRISALGLPLTAAGRIPNKYGTGWALVTLPFYLIADAIVAGGRAVGLWQLERDGYNAVYQIVLQSGHLALALFALVLAATAITRWTGSREAAWTGVIAVWAASPLFYYQTVNLSMSHGVAFFATATTAYALARVGVGGPSSREAVSVSPRGAATRVLGPPKNANARLGRFHRWLLAGAGGGLATNNPFQLGVLGLILIAALWSARRAGAGPSEVARAAATMAAGAAPFLLLQLWAWRAVYGEWLVFGYGVEGEVFHWGRPQFGNSLFSSWHGLFYWHPLLLVGVVGLVCWAWHARGFAIAWGATFVALAYVSAAWWCWWFASAFGNRSYDAAVLPLMAGAAWGFRQLRPRWQRVAWGLAIATGGWNFYVALLYRTGAISRSEPVTWLEMLAAAARLPGAAQF